jgi:hypothetical protein
VCIFNIIIELTSASFPQRLKTDCTSLQKHLSEKTHSTNHFCSVLQVTLTACLFCCEIHDSLPEKTIHRIYLYQINCLNFKKNRPYTLIISGFSLFKMFFSYKDASVPISGLPDHSICIFVKPKILKYQSESYITPYILKILLTI